MIQPASNLLTLVVDVTAHIRALHAPTFYRFMVRAFSSLRSSHRHSESVFERYDTQPQKKKRYIITESGEIRGESSCFMGSMARMKSSPNDSYSRRSDDNTEIVVLSDKHLTVNIKTNSKIYFGGNCKHKYEYMAFVALENERKVQYFRERNLILRRKLENIDRFEVDARARSK